MNLRLTGSKLVPQLVLVLFLCAPALAGRPVTRGGFELELTAGETAQSQVLGWIDFGALDRLGPRARGWMTREVTVAFLVEPRNWRMISAEARGYLWSQLPPEHRTAIGNRDRLFENPEAAPPEALVVVREAWKSIPMATLVEFVNWTSLPPRFRAMGVAEEQLGPLPLRTDLPPSVRDLVSRLEIQRDAKGVLEIRLRYSVVRTPEEAVQDLVRVDDLRCNDYHLTISSNDPSDREAVFRAFSLVVMVRQLDRGYGDEVFSNPFVALNSIGSKGLVRVHPDGRLELRVNGGRPNEEMRELAALVTRPPAELLAELDRELARGLSPERWSMIVGRSSLAVTELLQHLSALPDSRLSSRAASLWAAMAARTGVADNLIFSALLPRLVGTGTIDARLQVSLIGQLAVSNGFRREAIALQFLHPDLLDTDPNDEFLGVHRERRFRPRRALTDLTALRTLVELMRAGRQGATEAKWILRTQFGFFEEAALDGLVARSADGPDLMRRVLEHGARSGPPLADGHGTMREHSAAMLRRLHSCHFVLEGFPAP